MSFSLPSFLRPFFCKHAWMDASRWRNNQFIPAVRCTTCGQTKFRKRPQVRTSHDWGGSGEWGWDDFSTDGGGGGD